MSYVDCPAAKTVPAPNDALARVLEEARTDGVYSYQVADAAGISAPLLSLLTKGRRQATPEVARAVADALGVPVETVFNRIKASAR
jgi:transcriptional regulator with XRE-family HTH domain